MNLDAGYNQIQGYVPDTEAFEETETGEIAPTHMPQVPFQMWGALCFDLVLAPTETEQVCAAHGIAPEQLIQLLDNKAFTDKLKDARAQVKTLGASAGFVLNARAAAEKHIVTLSDLAGNISVNAGVRVRAIENITRYAHLDPAASQKGKEGANTSGVLVQFNIGGGIVGKSTLTFAGQEVQPPEGNI